MLLYKEYSKNKFYIMIDTLSETQAIKYIVLSGGGVKGVTYGGMHEALEKTRIIEGIEAFSGTSAGANTAAFLAVGMSSKTLKEKVLGIDLRTKLGSGYLGWFNDGVPVIDFINDFLIETIQENIVDIDPKSLTLSDEDKEKFEKLKLQINTDQEKISSSRQNNKTVSTSKLITFGDLALLKQVNPKKFKDLYVTAVKKEKHELKIFSTQDKCSENISIAHACRASSSLPLLFTSTEIEGKKFIDGAIRNNMPHSVFENRDIVSDNQEKDDISKYISKTLIFTLDENGKDINKNLTYKALHGEARERVWEPTTFEALIILIMQVLGFLPNEYADEKNKGYQDIQTKLQFNLVNLDTSGLTMTDFKTANDMGDEKYFKGYFSTMEHLINYGKLQHLSDEEYKVLVHQTRLQEFFFKVITGGCLDKSTQLYKDLMDFCKNDKFANYKPDNLKIDPIDETLKNKYEHHKQWIIEQAGIWDKMAEDKKTEYKRSDAEKTRCNQDPYKAFLAEQDGYAEWEKIKAQYNTAIKNSLNLAELDKVDYLKPLVKDFEQVINKSNEVSAALAQVKLQASLNASIKDVYFSSENIKNLFASITLNIPVKSETDILKH